MPETPRIYLSAPHMGGAEEGLVAEAFESNFIAPVGPHLTAFEAETAAYLREQGGPERHGVALASGTAALHLALLISGLEPGDTVLCSDLTFAGSAFPIVHAGARPVFIDCAEQSWNLDPALVVRALEEHPEARALIAVDLYGDPARLDELEAICAERNVALIEDAAEALGSSHGGRPCGSYGRFGVFSYNGNKIITTGGGGMLLCERAEDAERARFLATQARDPAPHYEHTRIGYNYRLSNIAAAIGRGQMRVLAERVARRREIRASYEAALGGHPLVGFLPEPAGDQSNQWLSVLLLGREAGLSQAEATLLRERIREALEAENIESRPAWKPMSAQPVFAEAGYVGEGDRDEARGLDLFARGLCLPSGTQLERSDLGRVAEIVLRVLDS